MLQPPHYDQASEPHPSGHRLRGRPHRRCRKGYNSVEPVNDSSLLLPALYSLPAMVVKDGAPIRLDHSKLSSAHCIPGEQRECAACHRQCCAVAAYGRIGKAARMQRIHVRSCRAHDPSSGAASGGHSPIRQPDASTDAMLLMLRSVATMHSSNAVVSVLLRPYADG